MEVTFDEFVKEMSQLVTFFIPWLFSDNWPNSSTTNSLAGSSEDQNNNNSKEVDIAKLHLQALGFSCFMLTETEDYILRDIKSTLMSLEKLYILSGLRRTCVICTTNLVWLLRDIGHFMNLLLAPIVYRHTFTMSLPH